MDTVGLEGVKLLASSNFGSLHTLALNACKLGDSSAEPFAEVSKKHVQSLSSIDALCEQVLSFNNNLRVLDLTDNDIGPTGAGHIATGVCYR